MVELPKETKDLITEYQNWERSLRPTEEATIHVDEVASKVAAFYEKIRGIVDWKEDHLLKRSAIERILGRRILPQINIGSGPRINSQIDAEAFVLELIRSGHFPNDRIEESKIDVVQEIINKYVYIINKAPSPEKGSRLQFIQWVISIAACEIEESLNPYIKELALMNFMYFKMEEDTVLSRELKESSDEDERKIQIFINVRRALFNLDDSIITYHLIKHKYPLWTELLETDTRLSSVAKSIHIIKREMDDHLNHSLGGKISQLCLKYNTPFFIISDILLDSPTEATQKIANPEEFELLIAEKYDQRLNSHSSKLIRAAFYSTLSIFLTNIVSLFAVEIPLTKLLGEFTIMACVIDIVVPTGIMALLVLTIPPPPKGNKERVIMETVKLAYGSKQKEIHEIKEFRQKEGLFRTIISFIYILGFLASIAFMVWALNKINFPPFSHVIFVIFLSMIAFAGTKIREKSRELHMVEVKESFLVTIFDLFALPIIFFGKWLTLRWKKYNVVSVFFNALIDMPFSVIVEFLEQWRFFLKEKKEKI